MDNKKRLDALKEKIQAKTIEKAKLEERKSSLEIEVAKVNTQLKEKGINSEPELRAKIEEVEKEFITKIEKAESMLG